MRNYKLIKLKAGTLASCQNAHLSSVSSGHWEVVWLKRITRRGLSLSTTTDRTVFLPFFVSELSIFSSLFFFSIALLLFFLLNGKERNNEFHYYFEWTRYSTSIMISLTRHVMTFFASNLKAKLIVQILTTLDNVTNDTRVEKFSQEFREVATPLYALFIHT